MKRLDRTQIRSRPEGAGDFLPPLQGGTKLSVNQTFHVWLLSFAASPRIDRPIIFRSFAAGEEMNKALERINQASTSEADSMFENCCGSGTWASMMTMVRPFTSEEELIDVAAAVWNDLQTDDWLEAFSAHPEIGETKQAQPERSANWSAGEQAGMSSADEAIRQELADANRAYFEKFGFIFIVCATGKSAQEMLDLCRARLHNDRETEIANAAREQEKITEIRLRKLCAGPPG